MVLAVLVSAMTKVAMPRRTFRWVGINRHACRPRRIKRRNSRPSCRNTLPARMRCRTFLDRQNMRECALERMFRHWQIQCRSPGMPFQSQFFHSSLIGIPLGVDHPLLCFPTVPWHGFVKPKCLRSGVHESFLNDAHGPILFLENPGMSLKVTKSSPSAE